MEKVGYLKFADKEFRVIIKTENEIANIFVKHLPTSSETHNIGGEIYFRTNGVDIKYNGSQTEEFAIGDVTYWRSPIGEDKFAIAIFYGNTKYSDWKTPRASSPCIKIGEIAGDTKVMESIKTGEKVTFLLE